MALKVISCIKVNKFNLNYVIVNAAKGIYNFHCTIIIFKLKYYYILLIYKKLLHSFIVHCLEVFGNNFKTNSTNIRGG